MRSRMAQMTPRTPSKRFVGHLPLVQAAAARVRQQLAGRPEFEELLKAGVVALHEAVNGRVPSKRIRFATYAQQCIRGAMLDSLMLNSLKTDSVMPGGLKNRPLLTVRQLGSPESHGAAQAPASCRQDLPNEAGQIHEFQTALTFLQKALANLEQGDGVRGKTEESAADPAPVRAKRG